MCRHGTLDAGSEVISILAYYQPRNECYKLFFAMTTYNAQLRFVTPCVCHSVAVVVAINTRPNGKFWEEPVAPYFLRSYPYIRLDVLFVRKTSSVTHFTLNLRNAKYNGLCTPGPLMFWTSPTDQLFLQYLIMNPFNFLASFYLLASWIFSRHLSLYQSTTHFRLSTNEYSLYSQLIFIPGGRVFDLQGDSAPWRGS
jgi:hypothetical protein